MLRCATLRPHLAHCAQRRCLAATATAPALPGQASPASRPTRRAPTPPAAVFRSRKAAPRPPPPPSAPLVTPYSVAGLLLWAGLLGYALIASPNQTPVRDAAFISSLVNVGPDANVGPIFTALFNIMGVWPLVYACLLIPAAKSGNKLPAWTFVSASFFLGFFALGPYLALWTPSPDAVAPLPQSDLEAGGLKGILLKGLESRVVAIGLAAFAAYTLFSVATAGPAAWSLYFNQFDESRFVHVTTLDFCTLTALCPFWLANDATARNWRYRDAGVPLLSLLPVLGPAIYLVLRPRAGDEE